MGRKTNISDQKQSNSQDIIEIQDQQIRKRVKQVPENIEVITIYSQNNDTQDDSPMVQKQVVIKQKKKVKSKKKQQNLHYIQKSEFGILAKIVQIPTYTPTEEEFRNPFQLIRKLQAMGYDQQYGGVKIQAPSKFRNKFDVFNKDQTIKTRQQNVQELKKGVPFDEDFKYTFNSFKKYSESFTADYQYKFINKHKEQQIKSQIGNFSDFRLLQNEIEYWSLVQNHKYDVSVDYAADLAAISYGSFFPRSKNHKDNEKDNNKNSNDDDFKYVAEHPFNLTNIYKQQDSLFQVIKKKTQFINGVTYPWVYFGNLFTTFCWHVEDNYMYALNYQHHGAPKTWYIVPMKDKDKFDNFIQQKYQKKRKCLKDVILQINPIELINNGITVYKAYQKPNEFIINFPKCYHAGFNNGFNVNEAVNMSNCDWFTYGRESVSLYRKQKVKQIVFPHEWIVYSNAKLIHHSDFSIAHLHKLLAEYDLMVHKELEQVEKLKEKFKNLKTQQVQHDVDKYDSDICRSCKVYCYLSSTICRNCFTKCCIYDYKVCNCSAFNLVLNIRVSAQTFESVRKSIVEKINTTQQELQEVI